MGYAVFLLSVFAAAMTAWVIHLKMQMRTISKQLKKRIEDGSCSSVNIQLWDKDAIRLASYINKCLEGEDNVKFSLARKEKQFRNMIADISHDLRTPLTSVKGYMQLLEATQLNEEQRRRMAVINRHTSELGDLIEHFYEYSYLLSTEPQLNPERFNLTNEVMECLAAAVPQFEAKCMSVKVTENPSVFVIADKEKTVRIIQNLIRNCLQHSAGDIEVDVRGEGEKSVVSIKNPVINPEQVHAERLFDRFYTGEKSRSKSTGLGLSIVKLLAEQMGGTASAELTGGELTISVKL